MLTLQHRSHEKELLDGDHIPFADIRQNMEELEFINRYLGGHSITIEGLRVLIKRMSSSEYPVSIVEIGCGGGDNLWAIHRWAQTKQIPVQLTGIDINAECIDFARQKTKNEQIRYIHSDYRAVSLEQKPQIIFSSLFCHHFAEQDLHCMLRWMYENTSRGFFINDLHRHWLAFYSIKALTQVFSKSYMVKNDAPVSVQRGFKRTDWQHLFAAAGLESFSCKWKWAFRWLVVFLHDKA